MLLDVSTSKTSSRSSPGGVAALLTVRVAVVDEHEIFRRGIVACLGDDPGITVVAQAAGEVPCADSDVTVASGRAAMTLDFASAVVACVTAPHPAAWGRNRVLAILPRSGLTRDRLLVAVRGAAVGLEMSVLDESGGPTLDDRRLRILGLLAEGADTREISERLWYSPRTIKALISAIEDQLDSRNRAHAVATAIRKGLI
jgi:DNA-binding NarL/FixJ family response regulator